ncbi:Sulfide:quinone oxidoreductase/flavo-binding protein [Botrytis cinerea]
MIASKPKIPGGRAVMAMFTPTRSIIPAQLIRTGRKFATLSPVTGSDRNHKIVVVGGGSAGLTISHQLLRKGKFSQDEIAIIDPATWHHYQPGWTLVGGGVKGFTPDDNFITLSNGDKISYDQLIVAPGIAVDTGSVKGLSEALSNPDSLVSSTYYNCEKVFGTIQKLQKGRAIFTQPAGIIKCAGAPQKTMWFALDYWKRAGLYSNNPTSAINITFATGLPAMFGVPKYNIKLEELRKERSVTGLFQHDLIAIDGNTAIFNSPDGKVTKDFDLLHVVPKNRPHDFVKNSVLADEAGFINVNKDTLRHQQYNNIWSAGDASNLPTSKTIAAITGQAPVLVRNLLSSMDGRDPETKYDGYTSCPLVTEYGKVILAEFKYGEFRKRRLDVWASTKQFRAEHSTI